MRSPESWLPEGFRSRTDSRGTVCFGWFPQARLLAHQAIAGFLTHGGWNSIIEGLPMVLPIMFDQGLNARNPVERKIGIEVPRNDEDGLFTGDAVAEAVVRLVLVEDEGECFKAEARLCKQVFGDEELQGKCVRNFLEHLRYNRKAEKEMR